MYAQTLTMFECLATMTALVFSCICMDLASKTQQANIEGESTTINILEENLVKCLSPTTGQEQPTQWLVGWHLMPFSAQIGYTVSCPPKKLIL